MTIYLVYNKNFISFGSRIWQQFSQLPRGAGEYINGEPPANKTTTKNNQKLLELKIDKVMLVGQ